MSSPTSKIDSKGRVSIPIALRAKSKLLEGSRVAFRVNDGKLVLTPIDNKNPDSFSSGSKRLGWCNGNIRVCGTLEMGSNPTPSLATDDGDDNAKRRV